MKNEKTEDPNDKLPVDLYPTIMIRVEDEMKDVIKGYGGRAKIEQTLKKY